MIIFNEQRLDGEIIDVPAELAKKVDKTTYEEEIPELQESKANIELDNLNTFGESRLNAAKAYSSEGEILTDEKGINDLINMKHSTFDLSKFIVVGSPDISEDGIASGLSNPDYIVVPNIPISSLNWVSSLNWKFKGRIKPITMGNTFIFSSDNSGASNSISIYTNASGQINPRIYLDVDGTRTDIGFTTAGNWEPNKEYDFYFQRESEVFRFAWKEVNTDLYNITTKSYEGNYPLYTNNRIRLYYLEGKYEYDLKQFSLRVDGEEIFSGNKTGIDVIKQNDYTINNSPTITEDGFLTGNINNSIDRIDKSNIILS